MNLNPGRSRALPGATTSFGDTRFGSCFPSLDCNFSSKYRTADGTCNNVLNPRWGSSHTTFIRLIPADYGDGENFLQNLKLKKMFPVFFN